MKKRRLDPDPLAHESIFVGGEYEEPGRLTAPNLAGTGRICPASCARIAYVSALLSNAVRWRDRNDWHVLTTTPLSLPGA